MRIINTQVQQGVILLLAGVFFLISTSTYAHAQVDVLTQHNNNFRTGANLRETVLTPENVNPTQFGMLFKRVVDDQLYTQPLVATGIARSEEHTSELQSLRHLV